jgi:tRNA U55 pseudouridine synthase TruB
MLCLERTAIGPFRIEEATELASLTQDNWGEALLPPATAVSNLVQLTLDDEAVWRMKNGQTIPRPHEIDPEAETVAVDRAGRLIGILVGGEPGELKVKRNFPTHSKT